MAEDRRTPDEIVEEIAATSALEGLPLTEEYKKQLRRYAGGKITEEELRTAIIEKYKK